MPQAKPQTLKKKEKKAKAVKTQPPQQKLEPIVEEAQQEKKGFLSSMSSMFSFGAKQPASKQAVRADSDSSSDSDVSMEEEVYMKRNLSAQECDSDDLEGELNLSEEECDSRAVFKSNRKRERKAMGQKKANKYYVEVDTNVFELKLDILNSKTEIATGDAEQCKKCAATLNHKSKIAPPAVEGGEQVWTCEFCNEANKIMIMDEEELPKTEAITYLLEASSQVQEKKMGGQDISVVMCLDVSGSMCVSEPIKGKFNLKGDRVKKDFAAFQQFGDGSDQFMNHAEKNLTYVSRLQCVQAAVVNQIEQMSNGAQDRKVGVVTFNNEVTMIGDGTGNPETITGDKLNNFDFLVENAKKKAGSMMSKPVRETSKALQEKVMSIEETGPTALGPAVLSSVALAAQGKPGSTVIICTDGLANIGLGAFDEVKTDEDREKVQEFYERVGLLAKESGVTINLISIKGDECNIDGLQAMVDLTGGNIQRVSPETLTQDFANILSKPVIATGVQVKVNLHKGLTFRNEPALNLSHNNTLLTKDRGNVTEDDVFTFEYTIKSIQELLELEDIDMTQIKELPFQAQIFYTTLNGDKCMRVITKVQPVSNDRQENEKIADKGILMRNVVQQSAQMARDGDMRQAQVIAKQWNRKMRSNVETEEQLGQVKKFQQNFGDVYGQMNMQNAMEVSAVQKGAKSKKSVQKNDELSSKLYNFSKKSMF